MTFAQIRKVIKVEPLVDLPAHTDRHGSLHTAGTVTLLTLECGHVMEMNPIFDYSKTTTRRCYECEEAR